MVRIATDYPVQRSDQPRPKLILAAADFAEGKGPPPWEYAALIDMRDLGIGYLAGGLRDQPAGMLDKARLYELVIESIRRWNSMTLRQFDKVATRSMRDTVTWVLQLRREKAKEQRKGER